MPDRQAARQLHELLVASGRGWQPRPGDRFWIPDRDLDADTDIFVIAEMTIEVQDVAGGTIIKFNGTTEWALDSIDAASVIWLPWEHQLRELLGESFSTLEALGGVAGGYAVTLIDRRRFVHLDAERAYQLALINLLEGKQA